jgi:hypothetical protein
LRSEILPEIPVKSRDCANVENVDNVDNFVEEYKNARKNPENSRKS